MKKLNKKGFTIVELVIVIAVIAILAAVLIPTFSGVVANANNAAIKSSAKAAYQQYMFNEVDAGKDANLDDFLYVEGEEGKERYVVIVDGQLIDKVFDDKTEALKEWGTTVYVSTEAIENVKGLYCLVDKTTDDMQKAYADYVATVTEGNTIEENLVYKVSDTEYYVIKDGSVVRTVVDGKEVATKYDTLADVAKVFDLADGKTVELEADPIVENNILFDYDEVNL